MANIQRIVCTWTGTSGLPGVSVFYGVELGSANADLKTFFTAIKDVLANPTSIAIPGSGDLIDSVTGTLTGAWSNPSGAGTATSAGGNVYAAGVGGYVVWNTAAVIAGRRLKGRTFLCPLNTGAYDTSGSLLSTPLGTIQTAATALVTAAQTLVWHRPGSTAGQAVAPVSATVPDQVTSLRSRRR